MAARGSGGAGSPTRSPPPDARGEPLALLPPGPAMWLRLDLVRARASRHWNLATTLLRQELAAELRRVDRELGFDAIGRAHMLTLAVYVAPGADANTLDPIWPIIYARGGFQREAILATARANARPDDPIGERNEGAFQYVGNRQRAYAFLADDVVVMFHPSMVRRLVARLDGSGPAPVAAETRFDALWTQVGHAQGAIRLAADLAAMRRAGAVSEAANDPSSPLQSAVLWADAPDDVSVKLAGEAGTDRGAAQVVHAVDEVRNDLLQHWEVRLMGFGRLLQQGLTAVNEGRMVRVALDARESEVSRVNLILNFVRPLLR